MFTLMLKIGILLMLGHDEFDVGTSLLGEACTKLGSLLIGMVAKAYW